MTSLIEKIEARWTIERTLDTHSFCVRARGEDDAPRRLLRAWQSTHPETAAELEAELERGRHLVVPNHLPILDAGTLDGPWRYVLQDFVDGQALLEWAPGQPLEAVLETMDAMLSTLAEIHDEGWVIGGRRPPRWIVTPDTSRIRLVDPGGLIEEGAREDACPDQRLAGLAPERYAGVRIDRRANLYEVGVLLHEALALQGGHASPRSAEATLPPLGDLVPELPLALCVFVESLLEPLPDERPATAQRARWTLAEALGVTPPRLQLNVPHPPPFVGRPSEIVQLLTWTWPLLQRRGDDAVTLGLVTGAAGAGKRRLLDEVALRAHLEGLRVLRGHCAEAGQGPFHPLAGMLRTLSQDAEPPASPAARAILPVLVPDPDHPPEPRAPLGDPEAERIRVLNGITDILLDHSRRSPLVLVLTDLDRAHPETRAAVRHLARRAWVARRWGEGFLDGEPAPGGEPRLLVLASARDGSLEDFGDEPYVRTLPLRALNPRDVRRLVLARAPAEPSSETIEHVVSAARGNPARALRAAADPDDPPAPGVAFAEAMLGTTRDDPLAEQILRVLAALGRPVEQELLRQAVEDDFGPVVRRLVRLGIVQPRGGRRLTLAWPELVQAFRRHDPEGPVPPHLLARQLERAADDEARRLEVVELAARMPQAAVPADLRPRLLEFARAEARRLEDLTAWGRAADIHALIGRLDDPAARAREAESAWRSGRPGRALRVLGQLLDAHPDAPAWQRASWERRLGEVCRSEGRDHAAREALERGLAVVGEEVDEEAAEATLERGRLRMLQAAARYATGGLDEARDLAEAGLDGLKLGRLAQLEVSERQEGMKIRGQLLDLLGQLAYGRGEGKEAEQLFKASLAMQERQGRSYEAARTLQRLGSLAMDQGDYAAAEAHWASSLDHWRRLDDRRGAALVESNLAMAAARRGSPGEARDLLLRSLRSREESGDLSGVAASLHNLGFVYACAGALEQAAQAYRRCRSLRLELGDRWYAALTTTSLAEVLLELGETEDARRYLEKALAERMELGDRRGEAATLALIAESDLRAGDFVGALSRTALSQRLRDDVGEPEDMIDALRRASRLSLELGNVAQALRQAERAVEWGQELNLTVEEGKSRLLLGEVLAQQGTRERARRELERGRRAAESVGDRLSARSAAMALAALHVAEQQPEHARALLDSRPVPRPGRLVVLDETEAERHGVLRVRERLLRAQIELSRERGSVFTAARCAEQAVAEARRAELVDLEWRALQTVAAVEELKGSHERALSYTVESQEIVEGLVARVPAAHRPTYLEVDSTRRAALQGDSPLKALRVRAQPPLSSETDVHGDLLQAFASGPTLGDDDEDYDTFVPGLSEAPKSPTADGIATPPPPAKVEPTPPPLSQMERDDLLEILALNRLIVDEVEVQTIYERLVEVATRRCGGERGFLALFGEDSEGISVLATSGCDDIERPRHRFARRCAFKAAEAEALVLSADVQVAPEVRERARQLGLGLRTVLAAPVTTPDGQRGALYVDHPFQSGRFGAREAELLEALADQCALAVGRAAMEGALHTAQGVRPGASQRAFLRATARLKRRPLVRFGGVESRLVGRSQAMERLVRSLEELSATDVPLLFEGPAGVGKGVAAKAAHEASERTGPLHAVDMRELSPREVESWFEEAKTGTLVLERIDEAPEDLQERLVRALEGGSGPRVIATAHDTQSAVRDGRLRSDLLALVSGARLTLPPLDQRPEDKGPLLDALIVAWSGEDAPQVPEPVRAALARRAYPGNGREVNAILRLACARARGRPVRLEDVPPERTRARPTLAEALATYERDMVEGALREHAGDLEATAKALGLSRRALKQRLERGR